jgi:hypothetical protein
VLLEGTGREPEAVPTLMNRNTVVGLERCKGVEGQRYSSWLRSEFPHGISKVTMFD